MKPLTASSRLMRVALLGSLIWAPPLHAESATDVGRAIAAQGNLAVQQIRASGAQNARDQLAGRLVAKGAPLREGQVLEYAGMARMASAATVRMEQSAQARLAH